MIASGSPACTWSPTVRGFSLGDMIRPAAGHCTSATVPERGTTSPKTVVGSAPPAAAENKKLPKTNRPAQPAQDRKPAVQRDHGQPPAGMAADIAFLAFLAFLFFSALCIFCFYLTYFAPDINPAASKKYMPRRTAFRRAWADLASPEN